MFRIFSHHLDTNSISEYPKLRLFIPLSIVKPTSAHEVQRHLKSRTQPIRLKLYHLFIIKAELGPFRPKVLVFLVYLAVGIHSRSCAWAERERERVDRVTASLRAKKDEHRHHRVDEARVPGHRSEPSLHQSSRKLQLPRLPPVHNHYWRLRHRRLPLRSLPLSLSLYLSIQIDSLSTKWN